MMPASSLQAGTMTETGRTMGMRKISPKRTKATSRR